MATPASRARRSLCRAHLFQDTASVTICVFTSDETDASLLRLPLQPDGENGLQQASRLMVDKITTVPKQRLGRRIGQLSRQDMKRLEQALLVFLGIV